MRNQRAGTYIFIAWVQYIKPEVALCFICTFDIINGRNFRQGSFFVHSPARWPSYGEFTVSHLQLRPQAIFSPLTCEQHICTRTLEILRGTADSSPKWTRMQTKGRVMFHNTTYTDLSLLSLPSANGVARVIFSCVCPRGLLYKALPPPPTCSNLFSLNLAVQRPPHDFFNLVHYVARTSIASSHLAFDWKGLLVGHVVMRRGETAYKTWCGSSPRNWQCIKLALCVKLTF